MAIIKKKKKKKKKKEKKKTMWPVRRLPQYSSAAYASLSVMVFQNIRHNSFEKNAEEGGREKTCLPNSNYCSDPFFCVAIHLNYTHNFIE